MLLLCVDSREAEVCVWLRKQLKGTRETRTTEGPNRYRGYDGDGGLFLFLSSSSSSSWDGTEIDNVCGYVSN